MNSEKIRRFCDFRAKVKGDAGMWNVLALDMLGQRVALDGARAGWTPIDKIQAIMRFTGLHDKNEVKIYEGDIYLDSRGAKQVAWFGDDGNWSYSYSIYEYMEEPSLHWEVIGNVFQNRDLINDCKHLLNLIKV